MFCRFRYDLGVSMVSSLKIIREKKALIDEEYQTKLSELQKNYKKLEENVKNKYFSDVFDGYDDVEICGEVSGFKYRYSLLPLKILLLKKNSCLLKSSFLVLKSSYSKLHLALPKNEPADVKYSFTNLCHIAKGFRVPLSNVMEFKGFDVDQEYKTRFGITETYSLPDTYNSKITRVSYASLRALLVKNTGMIESKAVKFFIEKTFQNYNGKTSKEGFVRDVIKSIKEDIELPLYVLYEICKELKCTIDFVAEWY